MSDREGDGRTPRLLVPDLLDAEVTAEQPVRFMDASGERLDLERRGFARAHAARTGRPADAPRDVRKLDISGDLNRIRSSRRRERETHRHVERIWLLRKLRPDVKTMAAFRKHNTNALQALCRECGLRCKPLELVGAALLAMDGSTFKAVNNTPKNFTQATREQALKAIEAQVAKYWRDLEASDRAESSVPQPTSAELQQQIERRNERQQRYHGLVQESTARGETPRSLTEPESRARPQRPQVDVSDNVPLAVDSKPQLSVAPEVTKAVTDDDQRSPLALSAQETLGVARLRVVADMGSSHGHALNTGDEAGIDADVPQPSPSAHTPLGRFGQARVTDAPEQDC